VVPRSLPRVLLIRWLKGLFLGFHSSVAWWTVISCEPPGEFVFFGCGSAGGRGGGRGVGLRGEFGYRIVVRYWIKAWCCGTCRRLGLRTGLIYTVTRQKSW